MKKLDYTIFGYPVVEVDNLMNKKDIEIIFTASTEAFRYVLSPADIQKLLKHDRNKRRYERRYARHKVR